MPFGRLNVQRPPQNATTAKATPGTTLTATTNIPAIHLTSNNAIVYDRQQNLYGFKKGEFEIQCKLEGDSHPQWAPKWYLENNQVKGILSFELRLRWPRNIPYDFAKVRVHFGKPTNGAPEPFVEDHAPWKGIRGVPMAHLLYQSSTSDPNFGANAAGVGANISGIRGRGRSVQSTPQQHWQFASTYPTIGGAYYQSVEFRWTHGWEDDYDARDRPFRGAVIVERDRCEQLAMVVEVEAKALKGWHKTLPTAKVPSEPRTVHPKNFQSADEFQKLKMNLNESIEKDNAEMGASSKYSVHSTAKPLIVDAETCTVHIACNHHYQFKSCLSGPARYSALG